MSARPPKEELALDMPFSEAMERFVGVDPKEMHANIAKAKTKKPLRAKKRKPPSVAKKRIRRKNVVSLGAYKAKRRPLARAR